MEENKRKLFLALYSGKITTQKFLSSYSPLKGAQLAGQCLDMLKKAKEEKDGAAVQEAISVASAASSFSFDFSEILGQLLLEDWHYQHEDIAMILRHLRGPSTVEYLYKAASKTLEYLAYDDTYQLARKCIKALVAIDNEEAINKIRNLSKSEIPEIQAYAQKELNRKGAL